MPGVFERCDNHAAHQLFVFDYQDVGHGSGFREEGTSPQRRQIAMQRSIAKPDAARSFVLKRGFCAK
jgi:hypothetical protein